MTAPLSGFYPSERTETWVLFDLRNAVAVEELHHARAVWQDQSDIEALDEDHFFLVARTGGVRRLVA
jgi:hypothetical protein